MDRTRCERDHSERFLTGAREAVLDDLAAL